MDTEQFILATKGMKHQEIADRVGASLSYVRKSLKGVRPVPSDWDAKLVGNLVGEKTLGLDRQKPGATFGEAKIVTEKTAAAEPKLSRHDILFKCPTGEDEYHIMTDGFAKGFPKDTNLMRARFRTPAALRRILEHKHQCGTSAFRGMYALPDMYKINSSGVPVDMVTGKKLQFEDKPSK